MLTPSRDRVISIAPGKTLELATILPLTSADKPGEQPARHSQPQSLAVIPFLGGATQQADELLRSGEVRA
jgi:hypothetical protein